MPLQHRVSDCYCIHLYFTEHKLATEVDVKGHKERNEDEEKQREKIIEKALD